MRGKIARSSVSKGKGTKKGPKGFDPKGIHPMTSKTGNKKMNRLNKGTDKRGTNPKVVTANQKFTKNTYF